jgi:hypothetical protein
MKRKKQTKQEYINFNFLSAVLACSHCNGAIVNMKEVIKWKKRGADIDAVNFNNRTAIDIVKNGQKPIKAGLLKYLISLKENDDCEDSDSSNVSEIQEKLLLGEDSEY